MSNAIVLSNISKAYRRHGRTFYALRNVSVAVDDGEVLGVVGNNGSGKTTMLTIILGSVFPTAGQRYVSSPIAAMPDLGLGFHDEFTGRENVYQNGKLMGLRHHEVTERLPAILEFSQCADIIDAPFKHYSSGERVRLEFAALTQQSAPILLVDDALASGDPAFHQKCLDYIHTEAKSGRTVVIVSHLLERLSRMTDRVLWLHKGEVFDYGESGKVIESYSRRSSAWRVSTL
jgi:lipopolysaccharide transport system ATP-binding protein